MKKLLLILLFPVFAYSQSDSVRLRNLLIKNYKTHFVVFAGVSTNSYYSKKFYISQPSVGYRAGIGLARNVNNKLEVVGNLWFQSSSFNISTNIYNTFYKETIILKTNTNLQQVYFGAELNRRYTKVSFGLNAGVNYLVKAKTTQDIYTTATDSIKQINIYGIYKLYDFMGDSYQNGLAPYIGLNFTYYPTKWLGVKYSNNLNIVATPWQEYQYYKNIYPFLHSLTININI